MKRFRLSLFSAIILVIVIVLLFQTFSGRGNSLFDQNNQITYYSETKVGEEKQLKAVDFFDEKDGDVDLKKITFDTSACDWNKEGIYRIPILYDGKVTNSTVSLTVMGAQDGLAETEPGFNQNTVITN